MGRHERRAEQKQLQKTRHGQIRLDGISKKFRLAFADGHFEEALTYALQASKVAPALAMCHSDAGVCLCRLGRWSEAIEQAQVALRLGPPSLATLDVLAHAHGELGQWDELRRWGLAALSARAEQFGGDAPLPVALAPVPPLPSQLTREYNLIAFSLFGGDAKYCETAVINASESGRIYPDWTCRFYVDETVPGDVLQRLVAHRAQVVQVAPAERRWPGQMWRFLAHDAPGVHRVIFRDADSVINQREAGAVSQWVRSDKRFHHMRDAASHTELLMAGLWGCIGGALPPVNLLVSRFLESPLVSQHFADQHFLRTMVWPYARESLLQHDSLFSFFAPSPFPDGPHNRRFHVGCCDAAKTVQMATAQADGTRVAWTLFDAAAPSTPLCTYQGVSIGGQVCANLPSRLAQALAAGTIVARVERLAD